MTGAGRRLAVGACAALLAVAGTSAAWVLDREDPSAGAAAPARTAAPGPTAQMPGPIAAPARAAQMPGQELPPGVTPEMVERGGEIFRDAGLCYTCHGRDGTGRPGLGTNLTDAEWLHGDGSYEYLLERIDDGVPARVSTTGVPMPPRGGSGITDEQLQAVAVFVWTLSR